MQGHSHQQLAKPSQVLGLPKIDLVAGLTRPAAFGEVTREIQVVETHISWVFLTDTHAFKVKKPVHNEFLDYSTLQLRHLYCEEELRLDRRYAPGLYLEVVPITLDDNQLVVDGGGRVVEYALKMHRFAADAQLDHLLQEKLVRQPDICQLARDVAAFHTSAARATAEQKLGRAADVLRQSADNVVAVLGSSHASEQDREMLAEILEWTTWYFQLNEARIDQRLQAGFVRECHGDLHVGNVVRWDGRLRPFDGIEFNDEFRWIDVLSDISFLAMDLLANKRLDLARVLVSAYLEATGDYLSLTLLRWYMVYRAMVRAKVATIRLQQTEEASEAWLLAQQDRSEHLEIAFRLMRQSKPRLWIMHGVSGSGKSVGAAGIVERLGAIRIRSDVERKRLLGMQPDYRPTDAEKPSVYSPSTTRTVYKRLLELARSILNAGYSVVVDAAFLEHRQRAPFQELAEALGTEYEIVCCETDLKTAELRLARRAESGADASDADACVLKRQFETLEPLTTEEQSQFVHAGKTSG